MTAAQAGWAAYWEGESAVDVSTTLADLPPALRGFLDAPWVALASALPRRARVLDLATGGGIVLDLLHRQRPDLALVGVDAVPRLPKRRGMTLRAGISTESLPYPSASFDAVTSRFGIEYGRLHAGGAEASRVLRPGGMLCLVLHHAGSNILRHNRARREALHWAARESGWADKALKLARTRMTMALPTPPAFRSAPADAAARFPAQSVAWEFLTGLAQVLDLAPQREGEVAVRSLVSRADGEIARLDALLEAACDSRRVEELTATLVGGGIELSPVRTVDESAGVPLAWHIDGRKKA